MRKRAMGLFLGSIVILESTERGLWTPSESHPPLHARIKMLLDKVDPFVLDADDPFWVFATCALLSKLRREERLSDLIDFAGCRDLFFKVLARLSAEPAHAN